jgi:hypothetical protein
MRLIAQATLERDLRKRFAGANQQLLGPKNPTAGYVGLRRLAKRPTKRSGEVTRAELQHGGKIVGADACVKICADIGADAVGLPKSEPPRASS